MPVPSSQAAGGVFKCAALPMESATHLAHLSRQVYAEPKGTQATFAEMCAQDAQASRSRARCLLTCACGGGSRA